DVGDLLTVTTKPILVSCRRKQDGGKWEGSEDERMQLLRQAIVAGPAYIELELDVAGGIPRFGDTKRVVSFNSYKPLANVEDVFKQAKQVKSDVVKFTWPTPTLEAAWPLLAAVTKKRDLPVVGQGIGPAGLAFSLLGRKYGSPWIYAALEQGMEAFEGEPTVGELDEVYAWRDIGPKTRFVGLAGFDQHETTTARVLNAGFQSLGLSTRCLPLALGGRDKLAKMLDVLKINALVLGPHAPAGLLDFADQAEDAAKETGCADLLLHQPDGWHAYNLLWRSALAALEAALGKSAADSRPLEKRAVLCLGGGATAALAWGVQHRQGLLSVAAPDDDAARRSAKQWGARFVPFTSLYDTLAEIVVTADPVLAVGHHKGELNPSYLRPSMTVLDLSHAPGDSPLLAEARGRGCRVIEPRAVLAELVAAQFKSVTGKDLPAAVKESL
ncbi:MAG: type I 3-dehydroquinate dehydratase, partial [Planctomycetaceae bacterium]